MMIVSQLSFATGLPNKELKISRKGIDTEPKLMFRSRKIISKTDKSKK